MRALDSAYGLAELMGRLCSLDDGDWNEKMNAHVDSSRLLNFASDEELRHKPYAFGRFCSSVMHWNDDLALEMAERFIPCAQEVLAKDPIQAFRDLDHEFFMAVLSRIRSVAIVCGQAETGPTSMVDSQTYVQEARPKNCGATAFQHPNSRLSISRRVIGFSKSMCAQEIRRCRVPNQFNQT